MPSPLQRFDEEILHSGVFHSRCAGIDEFALDADTARCFCNSTPKFAVWVGHF
jgi:hypothetical protein